MLRIRNPRERQFAVTRGQKPKIDCMTLKGRSGTVFVKFTITIERRIKQNLNLHEIMITYIGRKSKGLIYLLESVHRLR